MIQLWQAQGRGMGVQTSDPTPFPLQTSGFFFHLLPNNNEGEWSVSVGVGVQTGFPLQNIGFFYHLSDSNLGEGSGRGVWTPPVPDCNRIFYH